jgi:hypothetical protein
MMNINHLRAGATTSSLPERLLDEFVPTGSIYFSFGELGFLRSAIGRLRRPFLLLSEVIEGNTLRLDFDNAIGTNVPLAHCPGFVRSAFAVGSRAIVFFVGGATND